VGDNSDGEKVGGISLELCDEVLRSASERWPTDVELAREELSKHNKGTIFELQLKEPREVTQDHKMPETPHEKLRFIEAVISNCKTERLR